MADLPKFKAGQRVVFKTPVTGGTHRANVVRSRYSFYWGEWLYDIKITSNRSAYYPRLHLESSVAESRLREPV